MPQTDVVELCAILQCLGFTVKSLDTNDVNVSQDGGTKTIVLSCQSSGLHVVLESGSAACSCPPPSEQNSGFWQVSGVAGGKQADKESGSAILGSLPKNYRDRLSKDLSEMVRCIRELSEGEDARERGANKSASLVELTSPERERLQLKVDTPTRYRSLDTLTSAKDEPEGIPAPGALQKHANVSTDDMKGEKKENRVVRRQSTYTISSATPDNMRIRNKTSSPIQAVPNAMLDILIEAEKTAEYIRDNLVRNAEELHSKLAYIIREHLDAARNDDSSMSSLALDVSKISVLKGAESSKTQFASSPNLSGLGSICEDFAVSRLKRQDSASTSNLEKPKEKMSKLRRLSPSIFKRDKKGSPCVAAEKESKSKLHSLFKPKIITPVRQPNPETGSNSNLSGSKRKYSHIKSTIPRPTLKKE